MSGLIDQYKSLAAPTMQYKRQSFSQLKSEEKPRSFACDVETNYKHMERDYNERERVS
jgi:hypothetical protein